MCTKQRIFIWHFVCIAVQYLVGEVTVLQEGPLFQVGVYVSKSGCVPINLLYIMAWVGLLSACTRHLLGKVIVGLLVVDSNR